MATRTVRAGFLGAPAAGKSALVQFCLSDFVHYPRDYHLTTGVEIFARAAELPDASQALLLLYDFSGREMYFAHVVRPLLPKLDVVVLVYDAGAAASFAALRDLLARVRRERRVLRGLVVAHKSDAEPREVDEAAGRAFAQENGLGFVATSVASSEAAAALLPAILKAV